MEPVDVDIPAPGWRAVTFAKDQPQYRPLPSLICETGESRGRMLCRWTLTDAERQLVAQGADLFLAVDTFGSPLQPLLLAVGEGSARRDILDEPVTVGEPTCVCSKIQRDDPLRHFSGCPMREPLPAGHPMAGR